MKTKRNKIIVYVSTAFLALFVIVTSFVIGKDNEQVKKEVQKENQTTQKKENKNSNGSKPNKNKEKDAGESILSLGDSSQDISSSGNRTTGRLDSDLISIIAKSQVVGATTTEVPAIVKPLGGSSSTSDKEEPVLPILPPIVKPDPTPPIIVIEAPVIETNLVVSKLGDSLNLYDSVVVSDTNAGDLVVSIDSDAVDVNQSGEYLANVTVTNFATNKTSTKAITVIINAAPVTRAIHSHIVQVQIDTKVDLLSLFSSSDLEDGELETQIVSSDFMPFIEGIYTVSARSVDKWGYYSETVTTTIQVTNEAPVIHGNDVAIPIHESLAELSSYVNVTDREDGEIKTVSYVIKDSQGILVDSIDSNIEGIYYVTYTATDKHGKSTNKVIQFSIINEKPIIFAENLTFDFATILTKEMILETVTATDHEDGDLSALVQLDDDQFNQIDTNVPGEYSIRLFVTDNDGKLAEVTISIIINEKEIEEEEKPEEGTEEQESNENSEELTSFELEKEQVELS
ncbi:hypothetical protein R6Z02_15435 [Carnobacterium maltaromaticum]|uniref:hypothetical protein n=1 Tax=Lactobacillales TaxID=186826 RepID=UPI00298AE3DF|nr:hypothetical protein [Carnobacterium maltaromaticum]MDW5525147.1 hypothetical protein [Carnobacterium maltaromaticum]